MSNEPVLTYLSMRSAIKKNSSGTISRLTQKETARRINLEGEKKISFRGRKREGNGGEKGAIIHLEGDNIVVFALSFGG